MLKLLIISIACIVAIFLGFYSPNFNNQVFSGVVNMVGVLAFFCQFLYTNWDKFYVGVNKKWQLICNPKFDLIQTLNVRFIDDDLDNNFLEKMAQNLEKSINQKSSSYAKVSSKPSNSNVTLNLDQNGVSTLNLILSRVDDDEFELFVVYKQSVSYKDRIGKLNIIRDIFDEITTEINVNKKKLQLKLFFEKRNPFYGYILRENKGVKVNDFNLTFNINDEVDVRVENHYLEINSTNYSEFYDVLKDVIILANVKEYG